MAEPVRNPETGGRSLADILREAGIENPTRAGRRRRWDDMDDTGIRQRRADAAAAAAKASAGAAAPAAYGRRAGDLPLDRPEIDRSSGMPRVRDERFRRLQPGDARPVDERDERPRDARPRDERSRDERSRDGGPQDRRPREDGQRDDRQREDRRRATPRDPAAEAARNTARPAPAPARDPLRDTGRRATDRPPSPRARDAGPSTAAIPGLRPSGKPSVPGSASAAVAAAAATPAAPTATPSAGAPQRERRRDQRAAAEGSSDTGRIPPSSPAARAEDPVGTELDAPPRESALAWVRFAGELLIAAAVGVGVYFAFTVLWEMVPHVAALASPLVVTGLVLGVSTWRQRSGRGQLGARLLGVLVFAGTVLTILPAAGLLSG